MGQILQSSLLSPSLALDSILEIGVSKIFSYSFVFLRYFEKNSDEDDFHGNRYLSLLCLFNCTMYNFWSSLPTCHPFLCPLLPSLSNSLCLLSHVFVLCLPSYVPALIKKKIRFSPYIRKFRMEQLQSHIWLTASSSMGKYLRISSYIRKPFLIYDFATAPLWISLYMRKIWFSFLIVCLTSLFLVSRPLSPVSRFTSLHTLCCPQSYGSVPCSPYSIPCLTALLLVCHPLYPVDLAGKSVCVCRNGVGGLRGLWSGCVGCL